VPRSNQLSYIAIPSRALYRNNAVYVKMFSIALAHIRSFLLFLSANSAMQRNPYISPNTSNAWALARVT
jgi:hypothetical protein